MLWLVASPRLTSSCHVFSIAEFERGVPNGSVCCERVSVVCVYSKLASGGGVGADHGHVRNRKSPRSDRYCDLCEPSVVESMR